MFTAGYYDADSRFLSGDRDATLQTSQCEFDSPGAADDSNKVDSIRSILMKHGFPLRLITNYLFSSDRIISARDEKHGSMLTQMSLDNAISPIQQSKHSDQDDKQDKRLSNIKQNSDMMLMNLRRISMQTQTSHNDGDLSYASLLAGVSIAFGDKRERGLVPQIRKQLSLASVMSMAPHDMGMPCSLSQNPIWDNINKRPQSIEDYEIDVDENNRGFANNPHQALEYPVLYFLLKRFPSLKNSIGTFYRKRWSFVYVLQKRIPIRNKFFQKQIVMTWGELLFILPFIALFISAIYANFVNPDVNLSGRLSRLPLFVAILTSNHNSLFTLFMGLPFERSLKYHKLSGRLAFLNGAFHTYTAFFHPQKQLVSHPVFATNTTSNIFENASEVQNQIQSYEYPPYSWGGECRNFAKFSFQDQIHSSGSILLLLMVSIIITTIPRLRKICFEIFFYLHILFTLGMVACAFYHSGILVPIFVSILYGGDLVVRKIIMAGVRYPKKATIKRLTKDVVELSFTKTKTFDYNPGQYVYLAVPELSIFQWHPFSLSSSPFQTKVTLHIRNAGNWTNSLFNLSGKKEEIDIWLEGPYGSVTVDLLGERYQMIMFLSGGIGVTPMQSICNQLMYEFESGERSINKLWFIWTARDPDIMDRMTVSRRSQTRSLKEKYCLKEQLQNDHTTELPTACATSSDEHNQVTTKSSGYFDCVPCDKNIGNASMNHSKQYTKQSTYLEEHIQNDHSTNPDDNTQVTTISSDYETSSSKKIGNASMNLPKYSLKQISHMKDHMKHYNTSNSDDHTQIETILPKHIDETSSVKSIGDASMNFSKESSKQSNDLKERMKNDFVTDVPTECATSTGDYTKFSGKNTEYFDKTPSENIEHNLSMDCLQLEQNKSSFKHMTVPVAERFDDAILKLDYFLTAKGKKFYEDLPHQHCGRPDIPELLSNIQQEAITCGQKRVAICVCASRKLVTICRQACVQYSNEQVRFDLHSEVFD